MREYTTGRRRAPLRVAFWLATTSLSWSCALPALAQPAPPAGQSDVAGQPNTDPPPIAGSLAAISGTVSFHAAGETSWSPATLNYPVTNLEGFWTEPQASATIDVADDRLVMDESTDFEVTTLDQSQFVSTLAQGAIFVQLNSVLQGQTLTVNTPRGAVQISQAGTYEIVAGDTNDATLITVVAGAAHISGAGVEMDVGPQQTATISGTGTFEGVVGAEQEDAFLQAQLRLLAQRQQVRQRAPVPQQVQYMTGGSELASYGSFTQSAQYGQVWYPSSVPSNWAPYRSGHWAYVHPWGWTWVDNQPWGFAPFHYGRWAQVGGRWGWIAGGGGPVAVGAYPVYAPAMVAFIGVGGAGLGFSVGASGYAPAWIPLAPGEPYYPWYHCRQDYFAQINRPYGVPVTIINRGPTYIKNINIHETNIYINQRGATVVPAAAFARGEPVAAIARPVPPAAFAEARPLQGRLPVTPTALTPNLSPTVARRFDVALPERPVHLAAGPRIVPVAPGARAIPELRRASLPPNLHRVPAAPGHAVPGAPLVRAGEPAARPGVAPSARPEERGVPAARPPVARPEGLPARTEPGARGPEEAVRPGAAPPTRPEERGVPAARPPVGRPEGLPARTEPGARTQAEAARPSAARPGEPRAASPGLPEAGRHGPEAAPREEAARPRARPGAEARPMETREAPRAEAPREKARPAEPAARPEARRPEPTHAAERPAAPEAEHRAAAPHPAARPEAHPAEKAEHHAERKPEKKNEPKR